MDWLLQSDQDPTEPPGAFLSEKEQARFECLRFFKRRNEWLLGRWTAKKLVQAVLRRDSGLVVSREAIEIFNGPDGAPRVYLEGEPLALELSISHSHGCAVCAVDTGCLGADLEWIEARSDGLVNDFFTVGEQAQVNAVPRAQRDLLVTAIWSAKEAVLKALRKGLTVDTREVEIRIPSVEQGLNDWKPFEFCLHIENSMLLRGWWRQWDGFVLTLAVAGSGIPHSEQTVPMFTRR